MPEPSRGRTPRMSVREVVEGLHEPMGRRGFTRRQRFMAEATEDDIWVASWLREPPQDRYQDMVWPDGTPQQVGFADGVTVWSDYYVIVQVADVFARVEWRTSRLDADEFACVVTGMVDQVDRFVAHTGPSLQRGGFTRG